MLPVCPSKNPEGFVEFVKFLRVEHAERVVSLSVVSPSIGKTQRNLKPLV